jgi:hypothetical protein
VEVRYTPGRRALEDGPAREIVDKMRLVMGRGLQVDFIELDRAPHSPSGKRQFVMREF